MKNNPFSFFFRLSIQPTATLATSLPSSTLVLLPVPVDNVKPSRPSTFSVTERPIKLTTPKTESVTEEPATTKRPGRPIFLQPSKDTDSEKLPVRPTQSLASIDTEKTSLVLKSLTTIDEKPTQNTSTRTRRPEIITTVKFPSLSSYTKVTTEMEVRCSHIIIQLILVTFHDYIHDFFFIVYRYRVMRQKLSYTF